MLGVFVLHKDRIAKAQTSVPSSTPPIQNPPLESMPPPPPPVATTIPPLSSLGALASLLPPGGLNEQTKTLLQGLMASSGLATIAGSLVQNQAGPPPPVVPPPSTYGATYPPPPVGQYAGTTPPYSAGPSGLPPPSTYVGYAPPPPPPAVGIPPYNPAAGPSSAPAYGQAASSVHPSRQMKIAVATEGHLHPNAGGTVDLVRVIMEEDSHQTDGIRVIGLHQEMDGGEMDLLRIEVVVEEGEVEATGIVRGIGKIIVVGEEGEGGEAPRMPLCA
ncbi:hypothetical protein M407DRAFT_34959 [Tulasnella calospora MUT 4182]|uniref:Uncharacterized protein n=1 Tax=Tulasnella calospora MUT 4182 TaxID=1051891 RepID=A0A0C3L142_9AGAM|nr:hypothetical protein M407DRAFT_34959 [Tulasnella calospora MUT 4182]